MPLWLGSAIAKFQVQMLPVTAMGFLKNIASIYVTILTLRFTCTCIENQVNKMWGISTNKLCLQKKKNCQI